MILFFILGTLFGYFALRILKVRMRYWLFPLILMQLELAVFYINDLALVSLWQLGLSNILPYSQFWVWLNPFWGTVHQYLWFLFGWQMSFLGIMLFLQKRGKLSWSTIYWSQILNVTLLLLHNPQSIVPLSFVFLTPAFGPLSSTVGVILKMPLGWSWNLSDSHWACAFGNSTGPSIWFQACGHFSSQTALGDALPNLSILGLS